MQTIGLITLIIVWIAGTVFWTRILLKEINGSTWQLRIAATLLMFVFWWLAAIQKHVEKTK
jgi:hypothetical protein